MKFIVFMTGAIFGAIVSQVYPTLASDGFVRMLEMRMGVFPGATRVLPECGCTVRYVGTGVRGRHYTVQLDRLD